MTYSKGLSLQDYYKHYKDKAIKKNRTYVDYKTFTGVMKNFNLQLRDNIVYKSERVKLPYKLGELYIHKFEVSYNSDNQNMWKVNYQASKIAGKLIYHGSSHGYKWKWNKQGMLLKGKRYYSFKPCRTASRNIADAIKNKQVDYYN